MTTSSPSPPRYDWTSKAIFLLAGMGVFAAGVVWLVKRPWSWPGIVLVLAGLALFTYGEQMGDWCKPHEASFGTAFGGAFKHHGLADCWALVHS